MHRLAANFKNSNGEFTLHRIRDFSDSEVVSYTQRRDDHGRLRNRLSLLHIVDRNFCEIDSRRKVANGAPKGQWQEVLEINRLFMNYLASAYSLREHLKTHLQRDFGRKSEAIQKYYQFLEAMERRYIPYAFMQDFRNYVQHCGFPIGKATLREDMNGKCLRLLYSKSELLSGYTGWGKSMLSRWKELEIDLSEILTKHHQIIKNEFFVVITANYGANVESNAEFFRSLHEEAKSIDPSAYACLVVEESLSKMGGSVVIERIPSDSVRELGIILDKK